MLRELGPLKTEAGIRAHSIRGVASGEHGICQYCHFLDYSKWRDIYIWLRPPTCGPNWSVFGVIWSVTHSPLFAHAYLHFRFRQACTDVGHSATDRPDIFSISGSPLRLQELEALFNKPPRYGHDFHWAGYTLHNAASILLRYLLRSPEPVIPLEMYRTFQDPLRPYFGPPSKGTTADDHDAAIVEYQRQILLLMPPSRVLLLYLLDLLAVFASKAEINSMTAARLAAVFQPAILSPVRAGEDFIEENKSRRLNQDVVILLIEDQDHSLVDEFERVLRKVESEGGRYS
ncbi:hypothetical protein N7G274_004182 [Stereocaulon virgatum]|uniref:Rho-GAP domain-containing protein n=1 Tax=Stereocaulon virgatum TaxID=373712 RepID=A0ABR4AB73_9LECA